ncbi:hypothetical protein FQN49_007747 [Arthroderma sp. PD_2]|nr:hypothetical protein FQN49_007747 [Arthroderma sp. PD_2]
MLSKNLLYVALAASLCAGQECFYPDESPARDHVPCFSGGRDTHCCEKTSICMTNGYCLQSVQPYSLARGSCTDKNWSTSSGCPNPCSAIRPTNKTGCSIVLHRFLNGTSTYCANSIISKTADSITCAEDTEPFTINSGDIITDKAVLAKADCSVPRLNPTVAIDDMPSASGSSRPTPGSIKVEARDAAATNVAIGVGVGVPLGVIALLAIGWALYERKKRYLLINSSPHQVMETQPYPPRVIETQPYQPQVMEAQPYEMAPESKPAPAHELGAESR